MAGVQTNATITAGGTAQTVLAADPTRRAVLIQNTSDTDMWCNWLGTAANGTGWLLGTGQTRVQYAEYWTEIRNALSVWCVTTGKGINVTTSLP